MASADNPLGLLKDPVPMKKYRVTLHRFTEETAELEVEASTPELAEAVASVSVSPLDWSAFTPEIDITRTEIEELEHV